MGFFARIFGSKSETGEWLVEFHTPDGIEYWNPGGHPVRVEDPREAQELPKHLAEECASHSNSWTLEGYWAIVVRADAARRMFRA